MRSERSEGLIPAPRGPASTHPHLFQGEPQEAGPACAEPASRRSAPRSGGGQAPAHAVGLTRDYQSSVLPTDSAEDPEMECKSTGRASHYRHRCSVAQLPCRYSLVNFLQESPFGGAADRTRQCWGFIIKPSLDGFSLFICESMPNHGSPPGGSDGIRNTIVKSPDANMVSSLSRLGRARFDASPNQKAPLTATPCDHACQAGAPTVSSPAEPSGSKSTRRCDARQDGAP